MVVLAEENDVLKHRVDTLESLLRVTGCELQAVKIALGPWYHNSQNATPSQSVSTELPNAFQPSSASTSHYLHEENVGEPGPLSRPSGQPDALAAYFPAEDEILDLPRSPPLHPTSRPPLGYSALFGQSWDPPNTPGMRQTLNSAVAPLNLSTTLEGSLEALRQSIVTLSNSVDSLGRRSDIALTNETIRINEEMMSLKANVHGLRMQVHTILMDRNAQVTRRVQDSQESWLPSRFTGLSQQMGSGTKL
ncbi:hypothetical protein AAF712_004177 [Marasmius tenuissimus]|uniref:Uncharacterized protein n=1 Tax=Marasmius tenuissimus TaxID=585030 RepID=A0ABR3A4P3_9AGAR